MITVCECKSSGEIMDLVKQSGSVLANPMFERMIQVWDMCFSKNYAEIMEVIQTPGKPNQYKLRNDDNIQICVPKVWIKEAFDVDEKWRWKMAEYKKWKEKTLAKSQFDFTEMTKNPDPELVRRVNSLDGITPDDITIVTY